VSRSLSLAVRGAALAAALLLPAAADAQIFRVGQRSQDPLAWASLGVGLFQSQSVVDGTTNSEWRLGDGAQYRGSLEYAMKGGSSLGVVATHARVPLRYVGECLIGGDVIGTCTADGDVSVQSVWGNFRSGGGVGFHGVFEGGLGYTWYRDFEIEDDGADSFGELPTSDRDFSFYFGTGFGFGVSRRLSISVVQDFVWVRHQGEGLSGDDRTTTQQRGTRIGVRYGFGNRRSGL
jgi:hypothetical protein